MKIFDPIYGDFYLEEPLSSLCLTPEVRRLSQIRLLNTLTPSLATLGEVRRFSHTLGVLYLASLNTSLAGREEREAFAASVLLHDIGTPPFGHLFEYYLKERHSWNHENVIRQILFGTHAPENRAQQIFATRAIDFGRLVRKSRINIDIVESIVSGTHSLSRLLFGTLDFDNLDNVARMNWALGQASVRAEVVEVAKNIAVADDQRLLLSNKYESAVGEWQRARREAYDIIVFDAPTVAAQAVLSRAIETALASESLNEDDWVLTDEGLLELLLKDKATKKAIACQYLGALPSQAFVIQVTGSLVSLGCTTRSEAALVLQEELCRELGGGALGYVFVDRGTFAKKIEFEDPQTGLRWDAGTTSSSVILYGFVRTGQPSRRKCLRIVDAVINRFSISPADILRCEIHSNTDHLIDAQQTLKIAT